MPRQWEYRVEIVHQEAAGKMLPAVGEEGWELVAVLAVLAAHPLMPEKPMPGVQCFFKRPAEAAVNLRESVRG